MRLFYTLRDFLRSLPRTPSVFRPHVGNRAPAPIEPICLESVEDEIF